MMLNQPSTEASIQQGKLGRKEFHDLAMSFIQLKELWRKFHSDEESSGLGFDWNWEWFGTEHDGYLVTKFIQELNEEDLAYHHQEGALGLLRSQHQQEGACSPEEAIMTLGSEQNPGVGPDHQAVLYTEEATTILQEVYKGQQQLVEVECHVIYNEVYEVPAVYFRITGLDGIPLSWQDTQNVVLRNIQNVHGLESFPKFPPTMDSHKSQYDCWFYNHITQEEHPRLGSIFFMIHPCQVAEILGSHDNGLLLPATEHTMHQHQKKQPQSERNCQLYLLQWACLYLPAAIGCRFDVVFFIKARNFLLWLDTETSDDSNKGGCNEDENNESQCQPLVRSS